MDVETFIEALEHENAEFFAALPESETVYWTRKLDGLEAAEALKPRWFNEWCIGVDVIGSFVALVSHVELKVLLGRQIGDEAKHARLVAARIRALGGTTEGYRPPPGQLEFAKLLREMRHPEEFFAAEQLTVETQSIKRNELALSRFDPETVRMFETDINPDERFHVELGRLGLRTYAATVEAQDRARRAAEAVREVHRTMVRQHNERMAAVKPS